MTCAAVAAALPQNRAEIGLEGPQGDVEVTAVLGLRFAPKQHLDSFSVGSFVRWIRDAIASADDAQASQESDECSGEQRASDESRADRLRMIIWRVALAGRCRAAVAVRGPAVDSSDSRARRRGRFRCSA